jgi:hypothetical protein
MQRLTGWITLLAISSLQVAAAAEGPPAPPEPPGFLETPEPAILQTGFAADRGAPAPVNVDPTAPPLAGLPAGEVMYDMNGEFRSPEGGFTRFRYMPSRGSGGFGISELEFGTDFTSSWWESFCPEGSTRLRAAFGFGIHWWSGPKVQNEITVQGLGDGYTSGQDILGKEAQAKGNPSYMSSIYGYDPDPHLPPRVYDLYLDLDWQEHWSDRFMTDVLISPGIFTDFRTTPPQSFRLRGHAIGLYSVAPHLQLVGGVDFINRLDIKALPVAGVLWRPTDETRLHLVFPQPKISHLVGIHGSKEYWLFAAAEYGGGVWTYKTEYDYVVDYYYAGPADPLYIGPPEAFASRWTSHDRVEYSDIRLTAGIEFVNRGEAFPTAALEFGWVCNRKIRVQSSGWEYEPKDTFLIGVRVSH